jgi:phage shock protein A
MGLSHELISKFVKATNDSQKTDKKESIVYGIVRAVNDDTGVMSVELDGTYLLGNDENKQTIPASTTVKVAIGNRVIVMIKNHSAVITGNLGDPATNSQHVYEVNAETVKIANTAKEEAHDASSKVNEFGLLIVQKLDVEEFTAEIARIGNLETDTLLSQTVKANKSQVGTLTADNAEIKGKLEVAEGSIGALESEKLSVKDAQAEYATIENLNTTNGKIDTLETAHADFVEATAKSFEAQTAAIEELNTKKLDAESAEITYANIDFSNIGKAAIEQFFSKSGMIGDLVVGEGTVTGKLVGVTISGDLIEGNTVKAEKLVVKGSDGLYYKLNIDAGATTSAEVSAEDLQNGLHGSTIIAKTITAEKIAVTDLVAFGATIGGFTITEDALYSGAKTSPGNTTRGTYLDSDGQFVVGDSSNFLKYYKDTDGSYKLAISANSIIFGSSGASVEDIVDHAQSTADEADAKATNAQALIAQLSDSISMLVTDGNGTSLMTQTEDGWTFSTANIQKSVNDVSEALDSLTTEVGDVSGAVDILQQAVRDLGAIAEYVSITTYEDEPCIELGEGDSEFKLRITNTRMIFTEGSTVLAYFTNQSFHSKKVVVEDELQQGGFVWKVRANGNLGLTWKGGNN